MGQLTLYLDNETEARLKAAAKDAGVSVNRWVADLIRDKMSTEWPDSLVKLIGTWAEGFPSLEEIRAGFPGDLPREPS